MIFDENLKNPKLFLFHVMRKMPAIDLFVRLTVGPHVLKNAQINDSAIISANCTHGKKGATVELKNKLN